MFELYVNGDKELSIREILTKNTATNEYSLISTVSEKLQLLVPTLPKVDYFLRISNYDPEEDYLSILQAIQWIEAIYEIPILTEEGLSPKERKKITEIKTKLIF